MKLGATRELYTYWDRLRGGRLAPERAEIEPGAIRRILADTFMLDFDDAAGHPFRLAGTRVCAIFGRELKQTPFMALWDEDALPAVRDLSLAIAHETSGIVASAKGLTGEDIDVSLELLLLPIAVRHDLPARLIGTLAVMQTPHWLGVNPVTALTLGGYRHVGPAIDRVATLRLIEPAPATRPRPKLTLVDGGRSKDGNSPQAKNGQERLTPR
jgi:hypothetical protein